MARGVARERETEVGKDKLTDRGCKRGLVE
jgi:hypothetical protein